jgi:hypothetical protein
MRDVGPTGAGAPLSPHEASILHEIERGLLSEGSRPRQYDQPPLSQRVAAVVIATLILAASTVLLVFGFLLGDETGVVVTAVGFGGFCEALGLAVTSRDGLPAGLVRRWYRTRRRWSR